MPIRYYKCAKCKTTKGSYKEAEKCEQSHFSAVSVKEIEYRMGVYPFRLILTFPDGEEVEYIKHDNY